MDPLSITTAIWTLGGALSQLRTLYNQFANAPDDLRRIEKNLKFTQLVLENAQHQLETQTDDADESLQRANVRDQLQDNVEQLHQSVQALLKELKGLNEEKKSKIGELNALRKMMFKVDYIKAMHQQILEQRNQLELVQSNLNSQVIADRLPTKASHEEGFRTIFTTIANTMGGRLNRDRRSSAKSLYAHQHELIQAVRAGNKREVESLLGQVGDPNFHTDDEKQLYPLHIAAARGDIAMLDLLLECEARVDVKSHKGEGGTPLMSALTARHPTAAMTLITRWGANCKAYDSSGRSPLHIAAQKNMYAVVRQLLRNGANPNGCDSKGHTPLKAVLRDDREIKPLDNNVLRVLLNPPEGPGRRTPGADPRLGRAEDHYTPLHLAAEKGYTEDLRLMAQSGCGVVVVDSRRRSPLCYAAHAAQVETVRVLVGDLKADINQRSTDPDKPTPLWAVATSSGHCRLEGVEVLLEGGADPDVRNSEGEMLLHRACRDGDAPLLELLLHHHTPRNTKGRHRGRIADLDARDSEGLQAIHHAAAQGHLSCVRLLLQVATVDVNAVDLAGGTALIFAAEHGHLPILKYLVDQKADWRARDGAGNDAFYIACAAGDILCAAFLLGCGLDINGQNSKGNTPLHGAARRGHLEMVRWLLCMGADKGARSTAPFEGMTTCGTPAEVVRAAVAGELLERKVGEEIMRLTEGWSEGFERSFSWRVKGSERLDTEIEEMEEEDDTMKRIEEFDDDEETTVSLDGFSLRSSKIASPLGVYCPTQAESWERDAVREKPNS